MNSLIYTKAYNTILKTSSLMEQRVRRLLRPHGITHLQYHILRSLAAAYPHPRAPKDIKNEMVISSPDVTRILDRMVDKGWVTRKTCETNRRRVDVSISELGMKQFKEANSNLQKEINSYLSLRLSEDDIYLLLSLISKIEQKEYSKNN